jgi:large subunit ribosomal protein L24
LHFAVVVVVVVAVLYYTTRESRELSFFYASEIVLRSIPSRDDVFVRRVGIGGGRRRSRAEIFFFALGKFYPRERSFFSLFRFLLRKKPLSLSSVFVKDKKYTDMHTLACFITTLSLSPSFLPYWNLQKKKWEKQALNQNGKPLRVKMHVKTNDKVIVIAGADKGKVTEVVEVFTKNGQILCKDVNIKTKHVKPRNEGESGSIIQREFPIHHSNVMHYSEAEKKRSRVGKKMEGDKKVRVLKATGEVLAN